MRLAPRKPHIAQIAPAVSSPGVDAHLPTLCDDAARRAFLGRQLEGWEHRYARFLATEGASEFATDTNDPPHAADFLLTITALAARRIALGGRPICRRARESGDP